MGGGEMTEEVRLALGIAVVVVLFALVLGSP